MMDFDLDNIYKNFGNDINSHIFLIETLYIDELLIRIKTLIAKIIDADDMTTSQILNENYLELIIVKPDGKEIKTEQISELQKRIINKPILGKYIFYIIIDAETLNEKSANKLLKTIEEPPKNVIGFLLSKNNNLILPTIKSRCSLYLYKSKNGIQDVDLGLLREVETLIECIENKSIVNYNIAKSKSVHLANDIKLFLDVLIAYYSASTEIPIKYNLNCEVVNIIRNKNSYHSRIKKTLCLCKIINKFSLNINPDLLLEKIYLELEGIN